MNITLTQTLIKLINSSDCPRKWNAIYIEKTSPQIEKAVFTKGKVFEQLAIGKSAGEEDTPIPLLKNGDVPAEYKRIIEQAKLAKNYIFPMYGIEIEAIQFNHHMYYGEIEDVSVSLEGTMDIIGKMFDPDISKTKKTDCIIDLKLTGNLNTQFGDYSWAYPMNMDHTQAYMYTHLYEDLKGLRVPFYYMVFDYKANSPEYKIFKKNVGPTEIAELKESIRSATVKYKQLYELDFPEVPSYENCKHCTLKDVCKSYTAVRPINSI